MPLLQWLIKPHPFVKSLLLVRTRNYLYLLHMNPLLSHSHTAHTLSEASAICGHEHLLAAGAPWEFNLCFHH